MKLEWMLFGGLALGGLASAAVVRATQEPEKPKAVYAALYSRGPAWVTGKSPLEQPQIQGHIEHIRGLGERLIGAAPFAKDHADPNDPAIGLVVLLAESAEQAETWAESDPTIAAKVMDARVYRWNVEGVRAFTPGR